MIDYKPLGSRVIVRIITRGKVSVGGVDLQIARKVNHKEWSDECVWAEVIRAGASAVDVSVGDVIIMGGAAGKWLDKDLVKTEDTMRVIDESEALCIDERMTEDLKQKETANV